MKYYAHDDIIMGIGTPIESRSTNLEIIDADTLAAAQRFKNPACLNFASHKRPGGGYEAVRDIPMPIKTQEEDLFRRSNLPEMMDIPEVRQYYPLKGLAALYCSGVIVNKDARLQPCDPFEISLITVPAVVNPTAEHKELVHDKVYRIFEIAAENKHKDLILGAWGCGIFNNDPDTIARLFCGMVKSEFHSIFDNVVFAIPGSTSTNYRMFERVVNEMSIS